MEVRWGVGGGGGGGADLLYLWSSCQKYPHASKTQGGRLAVAKTERGTEISRMKLFRILRQLRRSRDYTPKGVTRLLSHVREARPNGRNPRQ